MADLTITITIPDAIRDDFLEAYADRFGWIDQATSGTKAAFAKRQVARIAHAPLRRWRQAQAAVVADQANAADTGLIVAT